MTKITLSEKILKNFSKVKLRKASVKVPRLRVIKQKTVQPKQEESLPVSSIVNILIKSAVEKAKKEKKEKQTEENKSYTIIKDEKALIVNGGYGTVSKGYGNVTHAAYVDYGNLFSHFGKFKAQTPYENMAEHLGAISKATEGGSFELVSREAMDKGTWYVKYRAGGWDLNTLSIVPAAGMSSAEWEQFKLWMKLDPVMYRLKSSTS